MKNLNRLKEYIPVKWRVQSSKEQKNGAFAACVCYIDARDAMDRLDEVFGIGGWQRDHKQVNGRMYAGVGILIDDQWRWFWDTGSESNVEKEKGESSDSFKRACVNIGIGRFMYDLPIVKVPAIKYNNKLYPAKDANDQKSILWDGSQLTDYINKNLSALSRVPQGELDKIAKMSPVSESGEVTTALIEILNDRLLSCTTPDHFEAFSAESSVVPNHIKARLKTALRQQMNTHNVVFDTQTKTFKNK